MVSKLLAVVKAGIPLGVCFWLVGWLADMERIR